MINKFRKFPLYEVSQTLSAVAQGRTPADLVVKNARLVNVITREILPHIDIAVSCGRIALVGNASHCIGKDTNVVDANGKYLCPGFLDGHIHVESSMLSVGEYARAVVPHGTVGIYMDPHEIANVLGLEGVTMMIQDSKRAPLKTMVTTPSCVPAVDAFEDSGAALFPEDIGRSMAWDEVVGLGEMMNFPAILSGADHSHGMVQETLRAGKIPTGHYSMPETGAGLNAYIASGIRCCHESTRAQDALAKMRLGMYVMIREGSAWHDLQEVVRAITQHDIDTRLAVLVSDDTHPHTLLAQGHMDHILRRAVEEGVPVLTALQMATINTAQCYQMDHELGSIAPSKCADFVLMDSLETLSVVSVFIDGEHVAQDGQMLSPLAPYTYAQSAMHSMHIEKELGAKDFAIAAPKEGKACRVIEVIPAHVGTVERILKLLVKDGFMLPDLAQDVIKVAVIERHKNTGTIGLGFVRGFGITKGAIASTVSHDAHNLLVIGVTDEDMAVAANALRTCGGGQAVVWDGQVQALLPLPIAGLMNPNPVEDVAACVHELSKCWEQIGCTLPSPFMTMALLALPCLPEIRLTNRGLVDCRTFQFAQLFV